MKYLDLFSGIGGFTKAIHNAHKNIREVKSQSSQQHGHTLPERDHELHRRKYLQAPKIPICAGFSEIDKHASAIYQYQFPTHKPLGDVTKLDTATIPDFDLLVGGFPCQSFSIAGKRGGFNDTRGTLFFEIARILRDKKPKYFLLENVKGLLSHDSGCTFSTIIETLQEIGYGVSWKVLNTKYFGIPQNRERVFIFGVRDECPQEILPVGEANGAVSAGYYAKNTKSEVTQTIRSRYGNGTGSHIADYEALQFRIRRLTPLECERLQGFPDIWTKYGDYNGEKKEVSDTQRYKCCGNAVTVKVVQSIIEQLLKNPTK